MILSIDQTETLTVFYSTSFAEPFILTHQLVCRDHRSAHHSYNNKVNLYVCYSFVSFCECTQVRIHWYWLWWNSQMTQEKLVKVRHFIWYRHWMYSRSTPAWYCHAGNLVHYENCICKHKSDVFVFLDTFDLMIFDCHVQSCVLTYKFHCLGLYFHRVPARHSWSGFFRLIPNRIHRMCWKQQYFHECEAQVKMLMFSTHELLYFGIYRRKVFFLFLS